MSTLIAVGTLRYNPNTFLQEMWDGKSWQHVDDTSFTAIPLHTTVNNGGHTITTNGVTSVVGSISPLSDNAREDLYQFLKSNLRVAEYLDENGKVDYVQLELREGEGCIWENIQRTRIK